MNQFNFNQVGGLPMTTKILDEIQKAFAIFNGLGALSGDMTIISGCATTGSNVSDGVVFVNGEVFEFKGGTVQTKVKIVENTESLVFQDGAAKSVIKTRYVTFGTGIGAMDWVDFKRGVETKSIPSDLANRLDVLEKKNAVFISGGGMVLWNKPAIDIPAGWAEVENWRGRMPVGFDSAQSEFNVMGKADGHKNKTLSINEMPAHSHAVKIYSGTTGNFTNSNINAPTNGVSGDRTSVEGGGQEFSLLNPYRVVMFIEFIG